MTGWNVGRKHSNVERSFGIACAIVWFRSRRTKSCIPRGHIFSRRSLKREVEEVEVEGNLDSRDLYGRPQGRKTGFSTVMDSLDVEMRGMKRALIA